MFLEWMCLGGHRVLSENKNSNREPSHKADYLRAVIDVSLRETWG